MNEERSQGYSKFKDLESQEKQRKISEGKSFSRRVKEGARLAAFAKGKGEKKLDEVGHKV